jgi:hypothetical protein
MLPPPDGPAQHAWYFFAIFTGMIVALILEPLLHLAPEYAHKKCSSYSSASAPRCPKRSGSRPRAPI